MARIRKADQIPTPTSHPRRCKMLYLPFESRAKGGWNGYVWKTRRSIRSRVTTQWRSSPKATSAVGFLDLPKEIRDIIYQYISDGLNRVGLPWDPKYSEPKPSPGFEPRISPLTRLPYPEDDVSDVAIMRTCHQLHAEFAEVLYASNIQIPHVGMGKYILPIASTYAHLVKRISMVFYTAETHRWPMAIDIAWAFLDIFPNIDILRVGWPYTPWQWAWPGRSGEFWEIAVGNDLSNSSDEEKVHKFEEYIREEIADGMSLPSQFQLLQERHGQCVETHFTEAVRNVQRTVSASADDDSASQDAPTEKKKKNDVIDPKQPAQPSMRYALRSRKDHNT